VQRLQAWGYAAELLPAWVVLAELEPGLAIPDPETPVAWLSGKAWVDAPAMTRRLVEAARNAGGRVLMRLDREVVAIGREGDRISSVTLRGARRSRSLPWPMPPVRTLAALRRGGAKPAHGAAARARRARGDATER
jgi:hypothetical protein